MLKTIKDRKSRTQKRRCNKHGTVKSMLGINAAVSFLGPHLWHIEVPRLGVKSELQLLAYTTATTQDPSQALSMTCDTMAHSNIRSLTHLARTGIKPTSSWILIGFVTC